MGSKVYEGIRFSAYPEDHSPRHIHGTAGEVGVIVDLLPKGKVALAARKDAIEPKNAKRNVVSQILKVAGKNVEALNLLWEKAHGER